MSTTTAGPASGHDRGFVLVWFAVVIVLLLAVSAFAVDILHGYSVAQRTQNAADAGALAGVQLLPDNRPGAEAAARAVIGQNAGSTDEITFAAGTPQNQLEVTVKDSIDTLFGRIIGVDSISVRRSSTAEFDPPILMGSPQNRFGNRPELGPDGDLDGFWASVSGRDTDKTGGNAAMSEFCETSVASGPAWPNPTATPPADNCVAPNRSPDYEGSQWFVIDKSNGAALSVHLFDPAFVHTFSATNPCVGNEALGVVWAVFGSVPGSKYDPNNHEFCTGDQYFRFRGSDAYAPSSGFPPTYPFAGTPFVSSTPFDRHREQLVQAANRAVDTTFELFAPDATPANPFDNASDPLGPVCSRTYQGYMNVWLAYQNRVADPLTFDHFHDWDTSWCSARPRSNLPGKYTLRVTTLPSAGAPGTHGIGANQFAIAAFSAGSSRAGDPGVHVSAVERMGISALDPASTATFPTATFYLARVTPSSIARTLRVTLFDSGDYIGADPESTIRIFSERASAGPPSGGNPIISPFPLRGCTYTPPFGDDTGIAPWKPDAGPWGTLTATADPCLITGVKKSTWNAQYVTIDVPIPDESGYWCDASDPEECWLKIMFSATSAGVRLADVSTWVATMNGLPIRLVE